MLHLYVDRSFMESDWRVAVAHHRSVGVAHHRSMAVAHNWSMRVAHGYYTSLDSYSQSCEECHLNKKKLPRINLLLFVVVVWNLPRKPERGRLKHFDE